ncbi:MAG: hypothetical protein AAFW46_18605 [Pseudomonadota bacterium]
MSAPEPDGENAIAHSRIGAARIADALDDASANAKRTFCAFVRLRVPGRFSMGSARDYFTTAFN